MSVDLLQSSSTSGRVNIISSVCLLLCMQISMIDDLQQPIKSKEVSIFVFFFFIKVKALQKKVICIPPVQSMSVEI